GGRRLQPSHRVASGRAGCVSRRGGRVAQAAQARRGARPRAAGRRRRAPDRSPGAGVGARDAREDRAGAARPGRCAPGSPPGARGEDPTLPLPLFIEARLLYDEGHYETALPLFQQAIAELKKSTLQIAELHFYTADTLARLERYPEAEEEFGEELKSYPQNVR